MLKSVFYDRTAARKYALEWALSRNPAYYDFSAIGGDCTSFVSQCIYSGCKVMNYSALGWFYSDINNRSPSWTSVEYLYDFLVNNVSVGPHAVKTNLSKAQIGDIIQLCDKDYDFYHSLFITDIADDIYVCAHTDNSKNRPLDSYTYFDMRVLHINNVLTYN